MVRGHLVLGGLVVASLLAACGADSSGGGGGGGSPAPSTSPPAQVTLSESQRNTTVHVTVGEMVVVLLHSTYWQIAATPDSAVLRQDLTALASPSPGCVPGEGCGVTVATFTAIGPGSVTLTASRRVCGEALRCSGDQGAWSATVVVG